MRVRNQLRYRSSIKISSLLELALSLRNKTIGILYYQANPNEFMAAVNRSVCQSTPVPLS